MSVTIEEKEPFIDPKFLLMKPRQLKMLANNIVDELKVKINKLKDIELTKAQKKLNTEYEDELYWKGLAEHIDQNKEKQLEQEYLLFINKLINDTTGKPSEFRIVELKYLVSCLNFIKIKNYENLDNYYTKTCLVILSNWK